MKPRAVIFDRDGTLVFDVPYNGDPGKVRPVPGLREALERLRAAGLRLGVVSNQSGIARGMLTVAQVEAVNARIEELLGTFDAWEYCPHSESDACACRKPKPKMILDAARAMGVDPSRCIVIGDKRSDVEAAENAGARAIFISRTEDVLRAADEALALSLR